MICAKFPTFLVALVALAAAFTGQSLVRADSSVFIWVGNYSEGSVTIFQDGVQKCQLEPDDDCYEVFGTRDSATALRFVFETGGERTIQWFNGPLHICLYDGPRVRECRGADL
jgi:hypothetical protein